MVDQLQKLTGFLNFLCRAIYPGRAFTRCMYSKFSNILEGVDYNIKKYHQVTLDQEFRRDCEVWMKFLDNQMFVHVSRPFTDFSIEYSADEIGMYSDATANPELGFGCQFYTAYTFSKWESDFTCKKKPSIEYLELYALCVGVFTWAKFLKNLRFEAFL